MTASTLDRQPGPAPTWPRLVLLDPAPDGSTEETCSDDLVRMAQQGHHDAVDALIHRYQAKLLRIATRYLYQPALAWDAVQQALAIVLVYRLHKYRFEKKFEAYLITVLINECRKMVRRAKAECPLADSDLERSAASPEIDQAMFAQRAMLQLTPKLRDVVTLRYAGGLSFREISEVLAIRTATARRRHCDALEKLQQFLEDP